jgi:hypothetical protein
MSATRLDSKQAAVARDWIPRVIAACSSSGAQFGGAGFKLFGLPAPQRVAGAVILELMFGEIRLTDQWFLDWAAGKPVPVGSHTIEFPKPMPMLKTLAGGVRLQWEESPRIVTNFATRLVGVAIAHIDAYPSRAVAVIERGPDQVWEW